MMAVLNTQRFLFRLMFLFFQRHHHMLVKVAWVLLPLESLSVDVTIIDAEIKEPKNLNSSTCLAGSPLNTSLVHVPLVDMALNPFTFIHNPISCFAFSSDFFMKTVLSILQLWTSSHDIPLLFSIIQCISTLNNKDHGINYFLSCALTVKGLILSSCTLTLPS